MLRPITVPFRLLLFAFLCASFLPVNAGNPDNWIRESYKCAILDAMVAESAEICDSLIAINKRNPKLTWNDADYREWLLVVTWTKYADSYPLDDTLLTSWGNTWVTVVPEIQTWFLKHDIPDTLIAVRCRQLLGLPPTGEYTHFVELWVQPSDLFRPSPDSEIGDSRAELAFPAAAEPDYRKWFEENIRDSYFPMHYPWTRLGYTYDWGGDSSEIGLSEFVIRKAARVIVHSKFLTLDYLQ